MKKTVPLLAALVGLLLGAAGAQAAVPARAHDADAQQRLHGSVALQRVAEQQRLIARDWAQGRLSVRQLNALEQAQSRIGHTEVRLLRSGHETVGQALRVQHLQDVQDWAIRTAHPVV